MKAILLFTIFTLLEAPIFCSECSLSLIEMQAYLLKPAIRIKPFSEMRSTEGGNRKVWNFEFGQVPTADDIKIDEKTAQIFEAAAEKVEAGDPEAVKLLPD